MSSVWFLQLGSAVEAQAKASGDPKVGECALEIGSALAEAAQ